MTSRNIVSSQLKNGYTVRHYYHEQSHGWNTDIDKQHASNYYIVDNPQHQSRTLRRRRPGLLWTTFPCCESIPAIPLLCILCCLITALALAVLLPILLISGGTTSTTTTASISVIVSNTITMNNSTTSISNSNTSVSASTSSSTSANISTSATTATTTSTTTTTTTTTNTCNGGYTYINQLLYLSVNSTFSWTQFEYNFTTPNVNAVTIIFSFRNDPDYWYLDDVSVTNSSGQELLSNGDFEQGSFPPWVFCNPNSTATSGTIYYRYSPPHNGLYYYKDGSVGAVDYLSQTFAVNPNENYTASFWLSVDGTYNMFACVSVSA